MGCCRPGVPVITRRAADRWGFRQPAVPMPTMWPWRSTGADGRGPRGAVYGGWPASTMTSPTSSGRRSRRPGAAARTAARTEGPVQRDCVLPISRGGRYTLDNVAPACGPCNASKCNDEVTSGCDASAWTRGLPRPPCGDSRQPPRLSGPRGRRSGQACGSGAQAHTTPRIRVSDIRALPSRLRSRYGRATVRMITAIHTLVYSDDATATRAFFKDVLQWPFVSEGEQGDAGTGSGTGGEDPAEWLIFRTGPSELGVHPTADQHDGRSYRSTRHHSISVMCDDLDATVAPALRAEAPSSRTSRRRWASVAGSPSACPAPMTSCSTSLTTPRHTTSADRPTHAVTRWARAALRAASRELPASPAAPRAPVGRLR